MIKIIIVGLNDLTTTFLRILCEIKKGKKYPQILDGIGPYSASDIECISVFDTNKHFLGRSLGDVLGIKNCVYSSINISPGILIDTPPKNIVRRISFQSAEVDDLRNILNNLNADVAIIAVNSFAEKTVKKYAQLFAEKGISVINTTPIRLAYDEEIVKLFEERNSIIVGDFIRGLIDYYYFELWISKLCETFGLKVKEIFTKIYVGGIEGGSLTMEKMRSRILHATSAYLKAIFPQARDTGSAIEWRQFLHSYKKKYLLALLEDTFGNEINITFQLMTNSVSDSAFILFDVVRAIMLARNAKLRGRIDEICYYGFIFTDKKKPRDPKELSKTFRAFLSKLSSQ